MTVPIHTIERQLSDGSLVYDVRIGGIVLTAVTERDANHLVDKLARAIDDHSTETRQMTRAITQLQNRPLKCSPSNQRADAAGFPRLNRHSTQTRSGGVARSAST